jgi:[ribosomal protein S5]-alanine N-acetyltransferase
MHKINLDVFNKFPVLRTRRLTLRSITQEDAQRIFDMRSNGMVNRFIARPDMQKHDDAVALAQRTIDAYRNKQAIGWAGILRDNDAIIGTCGFNSIDANNLRAEIGGEMATEYWGRHIAVEAVAEIIRFGFETMNLHTIEAKVSPGNRGAVHLLEQMGFEKEAHYRDRIYFNNTFSDMAVYTLISGKQKKLRL